VYFLGIDQGGSSSRVYVCDVLGNVVAKGQCTLPTKKNGVMVEQDPERLYESILTSIQRCLATLPNELISQIKSASLVTQRSSFVAINKLKKQPLSQIISWQDTRAAENIKQLVIDENWLKHATGLRKSEHYGASKMKWCMENDKNVFAAAAKSELMFLPLSAFLIMKLTNQKDFCIDPANASRTLLFNINSLLWQNELLEIFTIKRSYLPKVLSTMDDYGDISIAKAGYNHAIPMKYVNGDQSSAIFAYGQPNENELLINMGTGAFVSRVFVNDTNRTVRNDNRLLRSLVYADDIRKIFVLEGTVNGCGVAIQTMARKLAIDESFLNNMGDFESYIPIFINAIGGIGAPFWRTDINSRFIGEANNKGKFIAVLESIAFLITTLVELMAKHPPTLTSIVVSGGMSNNVILCQMLADLSGYQVKSPSEVEASVMGSIWWLADCPKKWLPTLNYRYYLAQSNSELLNRYQLWKTAMAAL